MPVSKQIAAAIAAALILIGIAYHFAGGKPAPLAYDKPVYVDMAMGN